MAENNSGDNRQSDFPKNSRRPNVPSGGFQGWLVVALIIALVSIYFLSKTRVLKTIEPLQFEQMVLHKEIAKLTIIKNKDIAEITLKKEALPKYKSELGDQQGNGVMSQNSGPHFELPINSAFSFETELNDLQKDIPREQRIHATSEERTGIFEFLMGPGLLILMFVGIYFMFFRMGGAGGPGGQIFNIGRSRATLFDGEAKVKITFNDVAGLDEAKEEIQEIVEFLKNLRNLLT
jgi:cell division protease FtsH